MKIIQTTTKKIKQLTNFFHPFLSHSRITQVFVWRHAICRQDYHAKATRNGEVGNYYEFGVFQFRSIKNFSTVQKLCSWFIPSAKKIGIYAFDSFQGLPTTSVGDLSDPDWSKGNYEGSLKFIKAEAARCSIKNIKYIEGYYENSLTQKLLEKLNHNPPSLVHIDCDLYSSTITVLNWLDKIALPGAIYFFDDIWKYHGHPDEGELKAIMEYNKNTNNRGMLIEDPLSMGSKMVYCFCPRNSKKSVRDAESLKTI